ncbi:MAG: potassium channel family protein [Phycisphaerales bacterium]
MPLLVSTTDDHSNARQRQLIFRLILAVFGLAATVLVAAGGYVAFDDPVGRARMGFLDGLWNGINAVSTAGDFSSDLSPMQKVWTGVSLVLGAGCLAFGISNLTGLLVSSSIIQARERRHVMRKLAGISKHLIICGFGSTGSTIAAKVRKPGQEVVVIEIDPARALAASNAGYFAIEGNAAHDQTLRQASIETAETIVITMGVHPEKIATVLMARGMNKSIFVVSAAGSDSGQEWLSTAGCDVVLRPEELLANEVARQLDARAGTPSRS